MRTLIKYLDESLFKKQEQIKRMVKYKYTDFVDLGLSVKWAKCNLGAKKETDYGHYYMWGSITPNDKDKCCWKNTPFNNGRDDFDEEYFNSVKNKVSPNGILAPKYDAAYQESNGEYRMPTAKEFIELVNKTNHELLKNYEGTKVYGIKFINKSDKNKFIFIPAAGRLEWDSSNDYINTNAFVWSTSINTDNADIDPLACAWCLTFNNAVIKINNIGRTKGLSIRPVQD